jgi:hypothetical protein
MSNNDMRVEPCVLVGSILPPNQTSWPTVYTVFDDGDDVRFVGLTEAECEAWIESLTNPIGIHCVDCTVTAPCEDCTEQIVAEAEYTNTADRTPDSTVWADRHATLTASMVGFGGLISAVQGLLVGYSLATGEIWESGAGTTAELAHGMVHEIAAMTDSWGVYA